ncbi:MAG: hypothetical protein NWQ54_12045 [Paraglaciecola sp.]|nr:hypothetical protein [Paraglaciecola sp.]
MMRQFSRRPITCSIVVIFSILLVACQAQHRPAEPPAVIGKFNSQRDLLLAQFDSKTDVDDIHSIAAVASILRHPEFAKINYHAVAGAYGIQEGEYVPSPALFKLAFANHWSDAHANQKQALEEVFSLAMSTLQQGGDIWIAEAGQSDFSALLIKALLSHDPTIATRQRVHIVQHSDWNQNNTSVEALNYVKAHSDYQKIADGNALNNGTAGYKSDDASAWEVALTHKDHGALWQTAKQIADKYNGQDGRYNNESIALGGFDFSDAAEMTWIFDIENAQDVNAFFAKFLP